MTQPTSINQLYIQTVSNTTFDQTDKEQFWWFLNELHYWSADLQDLRMRQQYLESSSIYFADKYARVARDLKTVYNSVKSGRTMHARKLLGLKGEAVEDCLYNSDDEFLMARQRRDHSEELKDRFDKLYWTTVRKHERISDQQSQNSRQGG